ncbi:hybrid sensor histidine kinase/response regulator [Autumnicola psychrophila]|uniref:histidine kinase n=1 Tax=Autumnicola psychrophila TaxID=3075592 RepID=A0ABU3DWB3_9FLAO|nr:ATP-binding protein [Zunongwangia sp. F225]MDT0687993.1 ATP-binding protein [Zunongwangia sp. F225]
MRNTRQSITFKVVAGYLILALLVGAATWFVYTQVIAYTNLSQYNNSNNEQLFMVSEITTDLYETENISRRLIQTGKEEDVEIYSAQIDSIRQNIISLKSRYSDSLMQTELDSIGKLLTQKTENLQELLELRKQDRNTNYYSQVLQELRRVDESFAENDYDNRFTNLEPHQRKVLISWLEYAKEDNAETLTNKTADSLVNSVKRVLSELEYANREFRKTVLEKEDQLLDNDLILNQQLRSLLSKIEQEEREASLVRTANSQAMLESTSQIIFFAGIVSIIIILIFLILILKDISRSQKYRLQLEEAKNFAETLLKRREQFMAAITHDLRSPLTTVIGYSDLMKKTRLESKQGRYLEQIRKSSDFILHLVNDLLDLSKLEAGKMLVESLPFNPKNLIEDTVNNNIPAETKDDVKVIIEASEETDTDVLSDPFRIKQIIANLVTNAYKFTEQGEIRITSKIVKKEQDWLVISIKDTGIGISEEKQEEIFEEFSQENSKIEKQYGGTGLGLTITKSLSRLLKGDIELKSKPGEGSEFIVSIPIKRITVKDQKEELKPKVNPEKVDLSGKKALVVDDENSQLALTSELVKSIGFSCETSVNGKQALQKLKFEKFDLVLTDIQMPIMDGFALIKEIRATPQLKDIPAIALSGRKEISSETYLDAGFNKNLLKPYQPAELLSTIAEIFKVEIQSKKHKKQQQKNITTAYDLEEIYLFSGGDDEAMEIIIKAFLDSSKENVAGLEKAYKEGDTETLGKIAHKMLPMLKQMKAAHVIPVLEKLERQEEVSDSEVDLTIRELKQLMKSLETEVTI